jgi:hypothetical protein
MLELFVYNHCEQSFQVCRYLKSILVIILIHLINLKYIDIIGLQ